MGMVIWEANTALFQVLFKHNQAVAQLQLGME